ncbi:MAG: hypothetical protein TR69_WS6001000290 [candidate division WS6 bacterium OLB20]|uniref:Uncharacterized protein n=1 Tax=candidate division WS6 bacterium OLB20 TaxID=1617426 RepID=A0A136M0I5_9BACT|nr:MAG: hypothetical protein TR69_WS6001000290 [candidate division WS6 bacterium OLB20]
MNPFRRLLRFVLGSLAKSAIRKHSIELIVITGWYGTDIARELAYTVLNDTLKVRRNTREIWWDFSLPLAILGYPDRKRSVPGWILLLLRASLYLTFARPNPHTLILNADCTFDHTARYWASFISADCLVILNYDREAAIVRELLRTQKEGATVVYNPEGVPASVQKFLTDKRTVTFGKKDQTLTLSVTKGTVSASAGSSHTTFPFPATFGITAETLGAVLALAYDKGIDLAEAAFNTLKFELPGAVLAKIRSKLEITAQQ